MKKVVMFTSADCVPCRQIKATLQSRGYDLGKMQMVYVDTDEGSQLAGRYAVHGVPTVLYMDGEIVTDSDCGNSPSLAGKIIAWN
jgi:thioredoxin-like negative regulator of GroEL